MQADVIGVIYESYPEYDEEGNMTKEGELAEGFHVNFPKEVPEFSEFRVFPKTPIRIYAGGVKPYCYAFANEDEWIQKRNEVFGDPEEEVVE